MAKPKKTTEERKRDAAERNWENIQLVAAKAMQDLTEAVNTYDKYKHELTLEQRTEVEAQIVRDKVAIENFLMTGKEAYVKAMEVVDA